MSYLGRWTPPPPRQVRSFRLTSLGSVSPPPKVRIRSPSHIFAGPSRAMEALWSLAEPYGALWSPTKPYGILWSPMEPYGAPDLKL